jgi:hypothetical protein
MNMAVFWNAVSCSLLDNDQLGKPTQSEYEPGQASLSLEVKKKSVYIPASNLIYLKGEEG